MKLSFKNAVLGDLDEDENLDVSVKMAKDIGASDRGKDASRAAKKIATTFAPRPSGKVKNPATPGGN